MGRGKESWKGGSEKDGSEEEERGEGMRNGGYWLEGGCVEGDEVDRRVSKGSERRDGGRVSMRTGIGGRVADTG